MADPASRGKSYAGAFGDETQFSLETHARPFSIAE
jgi:hypothetical protein